MQRFILFAGAVVVAAAAAWASFKALAALAEATGWGNGAWLLPTSIDVLGALACFVWLRKSFPLDARRFARGTTFAAIGISVVGNGIGHLVSFEMLQPTVLLIVLVGAVPPSSLAALIHLIVLATSTPVPAAKQARKSGTEPSPAPAMNTTKARAVPVPEKPKPSPKPESKPKSGDSPAKTGPDSRPKVDDLMVQKARRLDEQWQKDHGRPIRRDEARPLLETSNAKAGEALRLAREEGVA